MQLEFQPACRNKQLVLRRSINRTLFPVALAVALAGAGALRGAVSEPDNLIYGSLTLNSVPITAARTDVVIEARRTTNGPALASYRMGDNPALGDFYALTLPLEAVAPVTNSSASQIGDAIFVTVSEGGNLRGQTGWLISERGMAQRIDFGAAVVDGDGDGLPDAWELLHFAGLGQDQDSPAANGQTVRQNYLAGTDPNDPNDGFRLVLTRSNQLQQVSFPTKTASGVGYEGLVRSYTLETSASLTAPVWSGVSGYINIAGTNQTVVYATSASAGAAFFRGKIALAPANGSGNASDLDGDNLPDAWEMQHFGTLHTNAGSINLNGQTALQNYVTGTAPNNPGNGFKLSSLLNGGNRVVSFTTIAALGIGYEGKQRFYTLEFAPSPTGPWQEVVGCTAVLATNQTVTYQSPSQSTPVFFRSRVWLQP